MRALATDAQNKSRRCRNPNIYETCEHLSTTHKNRTGKQRNLRWLWAPTRKNTYKPNIYETCELIDTTQKTENKMGKICDGYCMATYAQNKSRRHSNPIIYQTSEHLNATTKNRSGERTYLRGLWPLTLKTNSEDAEINTFTKPMRI